MCHQSKLGTFSLGAAVGVTTGVCYFATALFAMQTGNGGVIVELMSEFYKGYGATVAGAFFGLLWGFLDGFIMGFLVALFYNFFAGHCLCCKMKGCSTGHENCKSGCPCGCNTK